MNDTEIIKENIKIVVVDDADFTRRSVAEILQKEGYNIVGEASSANDALQILGSTNVDIFIIDVVMPDSSGIELADAIIEQFANTPTPVHVIMTSSLRMENIIIDAISKGVSDFIIKPFEKDDIIKSVEKLSLQIQGEKNRLG